ncbi:hypothetical protein BOX30_06510 [Leptospirillum ferriphilum]|nr:hypothetical protein BOX30_06510 [Leptospirillum ferriphilum]
MFHVNVKGLFHLNNASGSMHPLRKERTGEIPRPSNPVDGFVWMGRRSGSVCGKGGGCAKKGWTMMKKALEESTGDQQDRRGLPLRRGLPCFSVLHWQGPCPEGPWPLLYEKILEK